MTISLPGDAHIVQAGCVAIGGRGVLITGAPGSGKSSLALALIDRGAMLVGDDGVVLSLRGSALWAQPHPQTEGCLEVRNLGILNFPFRAEIRIVLKLRLDPAAPRYIDRAECENIVGVAIPVLRLWPETPLLTLRAEYALRQYGLA